MLKFKLESFERLGLGSHWMCHAVCPVAFSSSFATLYVDTAHDARGVNTALHCAAAWTDTKQCGFVAERMSALANSFHTHACTIGGCGKVGLLGATERDAGHAHSQ